jgi:hypothetical protein
MVGNDAYTTNPAEAIRKAQCDGIDLAGSACLVCGSPSAVVYACHAICESSHVKKSPSDSNFFIRWLFLPFVVNFLAWFRDEPQFERQGHDVEVSFNLPVCDTCTATNGNVTRPAVAKRLMDSVPMYKELLGYYPQLKLEIRRTTSK